MKAVPLSRYILFFVIVVGGTALDLATKHWIFAWLGMPSAERRPSWLWENVLGLQTSLNEGALFGMGQGWWPLFAMLSVAAAVFIVWFLFWAGAARQWVMAVALSSIMGGVLGNLYDRLGLPGLRWTYAGPLHEIGAPVHAVRDWILVMIGNWPWPNFNVADSMLVCGAALLVWHSFWTPKETQPT